MFEAELENIYQDIIFSDKKFFIIFLDKCVNPIKSDYSQNTRNIFFTIKDAIIKVNTIIKETIIQIKLKKNNIKILIIFPRIFNEK